VTRRKYISKDGIKQEKWCEICSGSSEDSSRGLHGEEGGTKVLRNVGILSQHYMASQPRRPRLKEKCHERGEAKGDRGDEWWM